MTEETDSHICYWQSQIHPPPEKNSFNTQMLKLMLNAILPKKQWEKHKGRPGELLLNTEIL